MHSQSNQQSHNIIRPVHQVSVWHAASINVSDDKALWTQCNNSKENEYLILTEAWCGLSAGSTITPNYVDNSTSSVAPWCSCSASGSRREECDNFLEYFTNNICLRECHSIHNVLECTASGFWGRGCVCVEGLGGKKIDCYFSVLFNRCRAV